MKIIIPVKDNKFIASGFNATPHVCVFDQDKELDNACHFTCWREIIPQGTKITKQLKEHGIYAVLTEEMQLLAFNLFRDNGIVVYKSQGDDLYHNLGLFSKGLLKYYSVEDALENKKICGGQCNECVDDDKCK